MKSELAAANAWFVLKPNKKKCKAIFLANQINIKKCTDLSFKFCGTQLATKSSVKYLGIHLDSTLSWGKQTKEIRKQIKYKLSKIKPLSKYLDSKTLFMLIRSFTFPYIRYCSTTWSTAAPHLIENIQSVCDRTQLLSKDIPEINVRSCINVDLATLAFKAVNNQTPSYISSKIKLSFAVHRYNTRHSANNNIFFEFKYNKLSDQALSNGVAVELN